MAGAYGSGNERLYEFGEFRLIPGEGLLLRNGTQINLNPKAFALLCFLVERHGHLVSRSEIMDLVWEGTLVEEGAVSKAVWFVRTALEDTSKQKFIQTVPRRGYRFVAPVAELDGLANRTKGYGLARLDAADRSRPERVLHDEPVEAVPVAGRSRRLGTVRSAKLGAAAGAILVLAISLAYYASVLISSARAPRSLVVLPVAPISSADSNVQFELGIAESMIDRIGSSEGLVVRPLSSVRDYRGQNPDPIAVGQEQKADDVLVTNYQLADRRIKVTGQLYEVASGRIVDTFESQQDASRVFAAQDAIAAEFGKRLMARLNISPGKHLKGRGTDNEAAYRQYLLAMNLMDKRGQENSKKAREYLEQAVAVDPNYAQAWAGIALAIRHSGRLDAAQVHQEITGAANKALAIDPDVSDAYVALCYDKLHYEYDLAGAEIACRKAVEIDPNSSTAHRAYCWALRYSGKYEEALAEIRTAIDLEPVSYVNQRDHGYALYRAGHFEEAVAQWKRLIDLDPTDSLPYNQLIRTFQAQEKEDQAFDWFVKLLTLQKANSETIQRYTNVYQTYGWRGVLLERAKDPTNAPAAGSDFSLATLYAHAGEKDKAFEHLEKSFQQREWNFAGLWESPELDSLHTDPRFHDLVRRVEGR